MLINRQFYNEHTRNYTILFGALFNNIRIKRTDENGAVIQNMRVPLAYGPRQKYLAIVEQYLKSQNEEGAGKQPVGIVLPRMAFEITSMEYDPTRKLPKIAKFRSATENTAIRSFQYAPVPYNINFSLYIMTKNAEDGPKIYEQILPFFGPEFTVTANMIPEMGLLRDVPIIMHNMTATDDYATNYVDRRALIWTLNFTMKADFFGPVYQAKPIKNINVNLYIDQVVQNAIDGVNRVANINIRPGLTEDGEPTTDINETIPYADINSDDPWDFIETITEYFG